jgi:hypothetical protein
VVTQKKVINNHGFGIFLRDVSHDVSSRNLVSGNCAGIYVLADAPRTRGSLEDRPQQGPGPGPRLPSAAMSPVTATGREVRPVARS